MADERERPEPSADGADGCRARVFGDVLPEGTRDERGDAWGERGDGDDDRLRREVPPHHGG